MLSKLTLSVDDQVIEKAKEFARQTDRSLSKIVENYLKSIVMDSDNTNKLKIIEELAGKITLPEDFDEDSARREAMEKKYL